MPNSLTGSLIGSGGKSIKELIAVTDARINVSSATDTFPGSSDRVILISGTKEAVNLAQTLIWEMIGLMTKNAGTDLRLVEWDPRTTFGDLGKNDDVEVAGKFTIPALAGGAVLGKGGETIRKLATQTGARISMSSKDEALFTQERVVTLGGTVASCIACTDLVLAKLAEQPDPIPFVNRGTTYSSPLTSTLGLLGAPADMKGKRRDGGRGRDGGSRRSGDKGGDDIGKSHMDENESSDKAHHIGGDESLPIADTTITLSVPDELIGNIFGRQVFCSRYNHRTFFLL